MLTIVLLGDLWVITRSVLAFYNGWTLKIKIKHRHIYTDSVLMG